MPTFLYLSEDQIKPLVTVADIVKFTEEGYKLYGQYQAGKIDANFSLMSSFPTKTPHSDVDYRAGTVEGIPSIATSLGFGFWDNPTKHNLPSVSVFMVLNSVETGLPLAILGGYYIAAARTGAAGAVASKYLARKNPKTIGLVGLGSVCRYMLESHLEIFKGIEEARAWGRNPDRARRFAEEMRAKTGVEVKAVDSSREAVEGLDIVCTATPSRAPLVKDDWVSAGTHINAFGADAKGKQELDPKVLQRADKLVVDDLRQCVIGGEINVPLSLGLLKEGDVYGQIGEIVNGWKKGRESEDEITVMDSTGLSVLDVVCNHRAYEKALAGGIGTELAL
jgi:alanine dehydrogenase